MAQDLVSSLNFSNSSDSRAEGARKEKGKRSIDNQRGERANESTATTSTNRQIMGRFVPTVEPTGLERPSSADPTQANHQTGQLANRMTPGAQGYRISMADSQSEDEVDDYDSATDDEPGGKRQPQQHAGPVMGVFFKVWSFVKVTKMRNQQQKMQRQQSDQLQYAGNSLVQDNRQLQPFRPAGSQPAQGGDPSTFAATAAANTSCNTSSSGAGSNASSELTSGIARQGATNSPSSSSYLQRHMSTYSLRRSRGAQEALSSSPQPPPVGLERRPKRSKSPSAWAAKIKRSATSLSTGKGAAESINHKQHLSATRSAWRVTPHLKLPAREEEDGSSWSGSSGSNIYYSSPRTNNHSTRSAPATAPPPPPTPSTAPATAACMACEPLMPAVHQAYPVTKSFSTSTTSNQFGYSLAAAHSATTTKTTTNCGPECFKPSNHDARRPNNGGDDSHTRHSANSSSWSSASGSDADDSLSGQRALRPPLSPPPLAPQHHYHAPTFVRSDPAPPLFVHSVGPSRPAPWALVAMSDFGTNFAPSKLHNSQQQASYHQLPSLNPIGLQRYSTSPTAHIPPLSQLDGFGFQFEAGAAAVVNNSCDSLHKYKLAQVMLEFGSNPQAKDSGHTALMHAILGDNLPAIRCLLQHGANPESTVTVAAAAASLTPDSTQSCHHHRCFQALSKSGSESSLSALDLVCGLPPTESRLEQLRLLIELGGADVDRQRKSDGTRLLDRLIASHDSSQPQHQSDNDDDNNRLPYIECLLQAGAKLGSTTWLAASHKPDIQLGLLRKLCQDGHHLYKQLSIEAAVYRFEYALKRLAELELEQQEEEEEELKAAATSTGVCCCSAGQRRRRRRRRRLIAFEVKQIRLQTLVGLSRCERKRKFYRRALEFAQMAMWVDASAYEAHFSRAHILKELGQHDAEALEAIGRAELLVDRYVGQTINELRQVQRQQEESHMLAGCFAAVDLLSCETMRLHLCEQWLSQNLRCLQAAKESVLRLKRQVDPS